MKFAATYVLFASMSAASAANAGRSEAASGANPIRKVVTLLQAMKKKVGEEGEEAEQLYQKFMCYCKESGGDLGTSISAAEAKIPELASAIEASSSRKAHLEAALKGHQQDRSAARNAMDEAAAIRKKEKATYDKDLADNKANLGAVNKAVAAIEQGMGSSFLQSVAARSLRDLVNAKQDMISADRREVLAFLSGEQGGEYAPASGEIVGILKTMGDEMLAAQKDFIATEASAVKDFEALIAAKKREEATLTKAIEVKMARIGDLGVEIATLKNDAGDTAESLEEDKKFAADLGKNCAEKTGIHEEEKKVRAQEMVALSDTIRVLNDDDALDLFKKTLPSASASLLQTSKSSAALKAEVRSSLTDARARVTSAGARHHLDFILLALSGRKVGFDKIVKLIDNLVATLKEEQDDDNNKKEYCEAQLDYADDKKKTLKNTKSDLATVIAESKEAAAKLFEEINALKAGILALYKSLMGASHQRHAEEAEYKELMTSNTAARSLLLFAKNRLNKFYNPKLYKAPPKRDLSEGDQIFVNEGGDIPTEAPGGIANTGISAFMQLASRDRREAPAPPPATAAAYTKKAGESGGVIAMMDLLVADLDKEMQEAEVNEQSAREEYAQLVTDAGEKRRQDAKSVTDKEAALADLMGSIQKNTAEKKATLTELMGVEKYIASLHAECDWLVKYFDVRKAARTDEIDALGNARAVLSGADYSLVQRMVTSRERKFLQRA